MLAVSLLLHQLPDDVWHRTSYEDCIDLYEMHRRQNGQPASSVESLDDFDREQIANFKV